MLQFLKSFFVLIFIGLIVFGVTCGGAFALSAFSVFGILIILIGLGVLYLICKYFLGAYIWRYMSIVIIIGTIISIIGYTLLTITTYLTKLDIDRSIYEVTVFITLLLCYTIPIYTFHFYRIKALSETVKNGTFGGDIYLIFYNLFGPIIGFFQNKEISNEPKSCINIPQIIKENPETLNLMSALLQVDISNITSITFLPRSGQGFIIKTPNIKRLAIYITTKLGKTIFEAEELRKAFDHVVENISSDISKTDFNLIQGKISEFVKSGGEVKVERK